MDGVSSVSGTSGGMLPIRPATAGGVEGTQSAAAKHTLPTPETGESQSLVSISSTSISSNVESFIGTYGPLMTNNELLGAILLLLIMEMMQGEDDEKKNGLLALMVALAQQQQQVGKSGAYYYSSSSISIETTQVQTLSSEAGMSAYNSSAINPQSAPPADAGADAGSLDVVA